MELKDYVNRIPLVWFAMGCFIMGVVSSDISSSYQARAIFLSLLIFTSIFIQYRK